MYDCENGEEVGKEGGVFLGGWEFGWKVII